MRASELLDDNKEEEEKKEEDVEEENENFISLPLLVRCHRRFATMATLVFLE